ncbi:hypothetical protein VaNZ11_010667 [Volvox africanus]|uniref:RNA helicase n=1 Tax=Volvox africanus TaxID=51714 RepID=A0ABQ5SBJ8_9CHLO|nr:hypothetical protein VaNZ11_010667 [Volvox africanus]
MDAFALLTGGAKFDRRRYRKDIDAFNPKTVTAVAAYEAQLAATRRAGGQNAGEGELNGAAGSNGSGAKAKKRRCLATARHSSEVRDVDNGDADITLFARHRDGEVEDQDDSDFSQDNGHAGSLNCGESDEGSDYEAIKENAGSDGEGTNDSEEDGDEENHEEEEDEDLKESIKGDISTWDSEGEDGREDVVAMEARRNGTNTATTSGRLMGLGPLVDGVIPKVKTNDPFEEANLIRKALRIKVTGTDVPPPLKSFAELVTRYKVSRRLMAALRPAGFSSPTPIQRQAIPALMAGRELLAVAPTGSGKTLAFLIPLLAGLLALRARGDWPEGVKALVVSPTHELAAQQARVIKLLLPGTGLRACLLSKATATGSDFTKVDLLLANPLRLVNLVEEGKVALGQCRYVVLDEADKLFELGFVEQVDALLAVAQHHEVVRALFSATLPERVEDLARSVLQQPLRITVGMRNAAASNVRQRLQFVGREAGKLLALRQLLADGGLAPPVLVFVGSKERAKALHRELLYDGIHVDSITAGQPLSARNAAVENFRAGHTWVLIATDLIGRGMDFIGVNTVVNYDFPRSTADYVHRIGRTGRAGRTGDAVTFFTEEDAPCLRPIANQIKTAGGEVPDWMLALRRDKRVAKRRKLSERIGAAADFEVEEAQGGGNGQSKERVGARGPRSRGTALDAERKGKEGNRGARQGRVRGRS